MGISIYTLLSTFRHYEIDTGKCKPYADDNTWIVDWNKTEAKNEMINYMQIKKWGPYEDRLDTYITDSTNW